MANKVPFYVTWNLKNLPWTIFAILLAAGITLGFSSIKTLIRSDKLSQYRGEVIATITEVVENEAYSQSYDGNKLYISSYTVSYTYEVGHAIINNTEQIDPFAWNLHKIAISRDTSLIPFKVKYDLDNHWNSVLILYDFAKKD